MRAINRTIQKSMTTAKSRSPFRALVMIALLGGVLAGAWPCKSAHAQGLPLIRDTEIELLLNDYSQRIFRAAGLGTGRVTVRIVNDEAFNAFVIDGRNVFMNTGTLMQSNTPNEVIGVLAHEAGHISGGHMAALRSRIAKDQTRALLIQLLGIGAMIGGAASGSSEIGSAGQGVMMGGNELIMRGLTAERRSQESAADQAGLSFLNATQQSGLGMLTTFERFAGQELFSDVHQTAFARTHPVATDRLARLRQLVEGSPYYKNKDAPELQHRHDMMRAKLSGYMEAPSIVFNRYPVSDTSFPARYARAIASFRQGGGAVEQGLASADALIRDQPNNPFFWEIKGDFLQKAGRPREAIPPLRKALQLHKGDAPLIGVQLAQVLLQSKDPKFSDEAITLLRKAVQREPDNATAYNSLGQAYYDKGLMAQAELARAQGLFYFGALKQAQEFAKRAQAGLQPGSPDWVKADDIINYKPQT
jgi:predicted Zn-dependent protease